MNPSNTQALQKPEERTVEYAPYGTNDKIKLTASMVSHYLAVPTKSGKMPTERDCIRFVMLCKARKLNPFEGDAFMIGYDTSTGPQFSLITGHQAFLKRAELHPEFDGMESGTICFADDQYKDFEGDFVPDGWTLSGAWAVVHFKTRRHPMRKRLKVATFNKGYGQWKDNAAGMIVKCAEADALRSAFPTMLGGLYCREESGAHVAEIVEAQGAALAPIPPPLFKQISHAPHQARTTNTEEPKAQAPEPVQESDPADFAPTADTEQSAQPATVAAAERQVKQEAAATAPENPGAEEATETPQQALEAALEGVSFDDFRTIIQVERLHNDWDSWATWEEVPREVCANLLARPKWLAAKKRAFGAKKEEGQ